MELSHPSTASSGLLDQLLAKKHPPGVAGASAPLGEAVGLCNRQHGAARSAPAPGNNHFSSLVSLLLPWGASLILCVLLPELIGICCASDAGCLHA